MPQNETKPPHLAVLDPHAVRNLWDKCRKGESLPKGDFTAAVSYGVTESDVVDAMLPGLTLPAAGVGTEDERAAWDRDNDGDRFE